MLTLQGLDPAGEGGAKGAHMVTLSEATRARPPASVGEESASRGSGVGAEVGGGVA